MQTPQSAASNNPLNPETIVLGLATVCMLLIAMGGVGGFTVLAQRRLRSLELIGALGATDRNIRLVVQANGVIVRVAGALAGAALGLGAWLAYRPSVESSAHHVIGAFQLPWIVIGPDRGRSGSSMATTERPILVINSTTCPRVMAALAPFGDLFITREGQ